MRLRYFLLVVLFMALVGCIPQTDESNDSVKPHCIRSQSSCEINTSIGNLKVMFNVDKVPTETPFKVSISGLNLDNNITISGYLEGRDMFMGKIPLFFSRDSKGELLNQNIPTDDTRSEYITETMLGSCSEQKMMWRMWIIIKRDINNKSIEYSELNKPSKHEKYFIDFESNRS
jgi:hypothetical protein